MNTLSPNPIQPGAQNVSYPRIRDSSQILQLTLAVLETVIIGEKCRVYRLMTVVERILHLIECDKDFIVHLGDPGDLWIFEWRG
jgi:hypothetical protein